MDSLLTSLKEKYPNEPLVDQIIALHEEDKYSILPDPSYLEEKLQRISNMLASTIDAEFYIHKAITTNNLEFLHFMVNDLHISIKKYDYSIPLHAAIKHNNLEIVKFLVENGSDINTTTKDGYSFPTLTPYEYAVKLACSGDCSIDIALYLLDVLFRNYSPQSPPNLDYTARLAILFSHNEKLAEFIITNHPDINYLFKEITKSPVNVGQITSAFDRYRPGWRRGVVEEMLVEEGSGESSDVGFHMSITVPSSIPPIHSTANFNNLSNYIPH